MIFIMLLVLKIERNIEPKHFSVKHCDIYSLPVHLNRVFENQKAFL